MAKTSKDKKAADLEWRAAHNRAEADKLINNGATEEFVQELRDGAFEMEAEAARLRDPLKRRGKA